MISTIFNSQGIIALISIVFLLGSQNHSWIKSGNRQCESGKHMSKHATEVLILGTVNSQAVWGALVAALAMDGSNDIDNEHMDF